VPSVSRLEHCWYLVLTGSAGALSDTAVSDNVWDNYTDIASSNENFPEHPPSRVIHTPQRAEQFSDRTGAENMPVQTAASDVNITKIGISADQLMQLKYPGIMRTLVRGVILWYLT